MKLTYNLPRVLGSLQVPGTAYVCWTPCNARMGIAAPLGLVMTRWPDTTFRLFFERPELILHHETQQLKNKAAEYLYFFRVVPDPGFHDEMGSI
jgi:hypothetical protein